MATFLTADVTGDPTIRALFDDAGCTGSFCAAGLDDDATVELDADRAVTPASVIKVPVALAAWRAIEAGELDGRRRVLLPPSRRTPGPVGISLMRDDVEMSVRDLIGLMLTVSDNPATDAVVGLVGLDAVAHLLGELGMTSTRMAHDIATMLDEMAREAGFADYAALAAYEPQASGDPTEDEIRGRLDRTAALDPARGSRTTARDCVRLLRAVWSDEAGPADACAEVRRAMAHQLTRHRIAAGFPTGFAVAVKSGGLMGVVRNEIGVVRDPDGRSYAVAAFTRTDPSVRADHRRVDAAIGSAGPTECAFSAGEHRRKPRHCCRSLPRMRAWPAPDLPALSVTAPPVRVHDTASGGLVETRPDGPARLYVCGITPYDATHIGHAATYVAFDLLNRAWRNAGHDVIYVQNVTDVDDPLFERAEKVGVDWRELAARETELFRQDMAALRILPPAHFPGAEESLALIVDLIQRLQDAGAVYAVDDDLYFSVSADPDFGAESGWTREQMLAVFADRGGDPDRPGKKDPLDCLVWRAERAGEPALESALGPGRPGWHVECTAMSLDLLGERFDVQGGGTDLVFPHHEMCASEAQVLTGTPYARAYVHAGMVAYDGQKMSKSRGNLVFVSQLRNSEVDPMAVRLTLLRHHYRSDWEWTDLQLWESVDQLDRWRRALAVGGGAPSGPVVDAVLSALATDLDAPTSVAAIDSWADATLGASGLADTSDPRAGATVHALLDAALGLAL